MPEGRELGPLQEQLRRQWGMERGLDSEEDRTPMLAGERAMTWGGRLQKARSENSLISAHQARRRVGSAAEGLCINEEEKPVAPSKPNSNFLLGVYAVLMLICAIINSLGFKKMTSAMPNYSAFLSQVTTVLYIPIFGIICSYIFWTQGPDGLGGQEALSYPLWKFGLMGLLDGAGSVLMLIGGIYTSGSNQVILTQMIIPVALVMCFIALGTQYHLMQYVGSSVIMAGVVVTKLPEMLGFTRPSGSLLSLDKPMYNLVFVLSVIPAASSAVFKEVAFKSMKMDVNWMQFWVAVFQFLVGFILVPVQSLPFLGPQRVPFNKLALSIYYGFLCMMTGRNTVIDNCGGLNEPQCDNCGSAWKTVVSYMFINIAYNVFSLLVVKHGGATIGFLVSTLRLPLTTIAFCSSTIMGEGNTVKPNYFDALGLIILLVGLLLYRFGSKAQQRLAEERLRKEGKEPIHLVATALESAAPFVIWAEAGHVEAAQRTREAFYGKLSIATPLLVPESRSQVIRNYMSPDLPRELKRVLSKDMAGRYQNLNILDSISGARRHSDLSSRPSSKEDVSDDTVSRRILWGGPNLSVSSSKQHPTTAKGPPGR